jgi:hypothetical protein
MNLRSPVASFLLLRLYTASQKGPVNPDPLGGLPVKYVAITLARFLLYGKTIAT